MIMLFFIRNFLLCLFLQMWNLLRMRPVYAFRRKIECTNNNGSQENCFGMEVDNNHKSW